MHKKILPCIMSRSPCCKTITAVLNSATTAMLVIDNHGQITNMNGKAQDVLG